LKKAAITLSLTLQTTMKLKANDAKEITCLMFSFLISEIKWHWKDYFPPKDVHEDHVRNE